MAARRGCISWLILERGIAVAILHIRTNNASAYPGQITGNLKELFFMYLPLPFGTGANECLVFPVFNQKRHYRLYFLGSKFTAC